VALGTGEPKYEDFFSRLADHFTRKVAYHRGFNEGLAHLIEAGSDLFLMPSRYEPCGLNQMYSLRYGTLPLVRATGGLADTVIGLGTQAATGLPANGFSFEQPTEAAFAEALVHALAAWRHTALRQALQRRAAPQHLALAGRLQPRQHGQQ
jgi:starch synthase